MTSRRHGFTLIELLVVIGIIVLLIAILVPVLAITRTRAKSAGIRASIQAISGALDEYQKDYNDYPDVRGPNTGFADLGRALLGPGGAWINTSTPSAPAYSSGTAYPTGSCVASGTTEYLAIVDVPAGNAPPVNDYWTAFAYSDGHDGFGAAVNGKATRPYLSPERIKTRGTALLDADENPIAYFRGRAGKNNLDRPIGTTTIGSYVDRSPQSQYDASNSLSLFLQPGEKWSVPNDQDKALKRLRYMMGAYNAGDPGTGTVGCLAPGKTAVDRPFLLWSAGPDGFFGPRLDPNDAQQKRNVDKCDDITNFQ